jgi:hypothetical protein
LCEHLEIDEFGTYTIRGGKKEETASLMKCGSCGKFLTLDSKIIPKRNIVRKVSATRENMRTITVQLNGDIFERIQNLSSGNLGEDKSKVMNELLGLGLRYYHRILPKAHETKS